MGEINVYSCDLETVSCEETPLKNYYQVSPDSIVESSIVDDYIFLLSSSSNIQSISLFSNATSYYQLNNFQIPIYCGHTAYRNLIFLFGGIFKKNLENSLVEIRINPNINVAYHILSKAQISPPLRLKSALFTVRNKIYLYGGLGKSDYLNDMWTYTPSHSKWSQIFYQSNSPSPRHSFAYGSAGDTIIIWEEKQHLAIATSFLYTIQ